MTLQLTSVLEQRLENLAAETHNSPEALAQSAMENFLDESEGLAAAVREADAEFARGEFPAHEEVSALFAKRFHRS